MVKLFIGIFIVAAISSQGFAQLRCFVCDNCPDPFDRNNDLVQTCENPVPTTTTTTTLEPDTTVSVIIPTIPTEEPTTTAPPVTPPPITSPELTAATQATTTIPTTTPIGIPPTTTLGPTPAPAPVPQLRKRRATRQENEIRMQCFRLEVLINEQQIVRRGCVAAQVDDTATCLVASNGLTPQHCTLCEGEGCNTGTRLAISFLAIFSVIFIALRN